MKLAERPAPDEVLVAIADYALAPQVGSPLAREMARWCLMDALACGFLALRHPSCARLLGPVVPGATLPGGARVPGTSYELDPVQAAFSIGTMIRWLDYNDTWLAQEWAHPSDNLGAILAVADWLARRRVLEGRSPPLVAELLDATTRAYEIQGVLALDNAFNRAGLDHVLLVRVASSAVAAAMLGATREQVIDAVSNAWADGGSLRVYRHAPTAGSRKGWAAGDAASRGVRHALLTLAGEMGYPSVLTAPEWGFEHVLLGGERVKLSRPLGCHVIENVIFKACWPAECHAQSAVECALALHEAVRERLADVDRVLVETQAPALRIIDRRGPLGHPAERDHCLQYIVAAALVLGRLEAGDYEDAIAWDPRIEQLRARTILEENPAFTADYHAPERRAVGNAIRVIFRDGSSTGRVQIDYPIGHPRRRAEALPLVARKFDAAVAAHFHPRQAERIRALFADGERLAGLPVTELMASLVAN